MFLAVVYESAWKTFNTRMIGYSLHIARLFLLEERLQIITNKVQEQSVSIQCQTINQITLKIVCVMIFQPLFSAYESERMKIPFNGTRFCQWSLPAFCCTTAKILALAPNRRKHGNKGGGTRLGERRRNGELNVGTRGIPRNCILFCITLCLPASYTILRNYEWRGGGRINSKIKSFWRHAIIRWTL